MELLCPSCQQRLTLPDQYAGQLMKCPLCANNFTAPALQPVSAAPIAPPPVAPPPPAPAYTPPSGPLPPPSSPPILEGTAPFPSPPDTPAPQPESELPAAPLPPLPPGSATDERGIYTIWISPRVVPWLAPVGITLVFLLTFLPWVYGLGFTVSEREITLASHNAWGLSFGRDYNLFFTFFIILTILAMVVSIASLLITLKIIPMPPALALIEPWRPVIVGGLVLLSFLCFAVKYVDFVFSAAPMTIWMRLAFCLHLVAVAGSFLEFWLAGRAATRPMPRIEFHW
jgi:hypothetical protein